MPHETTSSSRSHAGFRFPYDKYEDEVALYANFRYLQEYLRLLGQGDKYATTVIVAASNSHNRSSAHFKCDGVNDDVELGEAFDALPSSGGEVVLLEGTYTLGGNVSIDKKVRFVGHGATIALAENTMTFNNQVEIEGFTFTNTNTSSLATWLTLAGGVRKWVHNCHFSGGGCGESGVINLSGPFSWSDFWLTDCKFDNITCNGDGFSYNNLMHGNSSGGEVHIVFANNIFDNIKTGTGGAFGTHLYRDNGGTQDIMPINNIYRSVALANLPANNAHYIEDGTYKAGSHSGVDHGGLSGLADDDHTQYLLADGTRNLTAKLEFDEASEPAAPGTDDVVVWAEDEQGFGTLHWKSSEDISFELSRDRHLVVRNDTGAQINVGEAVYISGSTGVVPNVAKARANSSATMPAIGIAIANIANASFGRIKLAGDIDGLDLSAFTDGDVLYVSAATAGALTATKPAAGSIQQLIGSVTTAGTGANGVLLVDVGNALIEADIDHGSISGLTDDDHTQYVLRSILTTQGDLFTRDGSAIKRLAIGTEGQFLKAGASEPAWADVETDPFADILMLGGM